MNIKNNKLFMLTMLMSALSGVILSIAYITTNEQGDAYLLVMVEFVALACFAGWLIHMLLLVLPALARRLFHTLSALRPRYAPLAEEGPEWALVNMRREMLAVRLQVDEPRFCARRGIPCDCWSFCGGDADVSVDSAALAPGYLVGLSNIKHDSNKDALPVIKDRNVSDCSFR